MQAEKGTDQSQCEDESTDTSGACCTLDSWDKEQRSRAGRDQRHPKNKSIETSKSGGHEGDHLDKKESGQVLAAYHGRGWVIVEPEEEGSETDLARQLDGISIQWHVHGSVPTVVGLFLVVVVVVVVVGRGGD